MKTHELETLRMANELLELLNHQNLTKSELCRELTLHTFRPFDAVAVSLIELNDDGTFRGDHSYGLSEIETIEWKSISLSDKRPSSRAIRENKPIWVDVEGGGLDEYPLSKAFGFDKISRSQVVWPVTKSGIPVGAINLFFNKPILISKLSLTYLELIAHIVAIRLTSPLPFAPESILTLKDVNPHDALSAREINVLEGIANFMTNTQIAEKLGFSESTIRQDTIQIYRKMGVAGRVEARSHYLEKRNS